MATQPDNTARESRSLKGKASSRIRAASMQCLATAGRDGAWTICWMATINCRVSGREVIIDALRNESTRDIPISKIPSRYL